MLGHQRLQPTDKVRVLPSGQAQRNPLLDRREPQLIQLARLAPSPVIETLTTAISPARCRSARIEPVGRIPAFCAAIWASRARMNLFQT
jgi:hypothetical protein